MLGFSYLHIYWHWQDLVWGSISPFILTHRYVHTTYSFGLRPKICPYFLAQSQQWPSNYRHNRCWFASLPTHQWPPPSLHSQEARQKRNLVGNARLVGPNHSDLGHHQWWFGIDARWEYSQGRDCIWSNRGSNVGHLGCCCILGPTQINWWDW